MTISPVIAIPIQTFRGAQETCTILSSPPCIGSKIAYKVLEMSSIDYTPRISAYREACVRSSDENGTLELQLSPELVKNNKSDEHKGRFEMPTDDEDEGDVPRGKGEELVSITWSELVEPRLLT